MVQCNNGGCGPQQREAGHLRTLDSTPESQAVKRRHRIINSELMEVEQCHESYQTADLLKTAYKLGFRIHCMTSLSEDLCLICFA